MTQTKTERRINSDHDAWMYWEEEYGLPNSFSRYTELSDVEIRLSYLQIEQESLNKEIQSRDVNYMNGATINRAIELHFMVEVGSKYFTKCIEAAGQAEEEMESEFSRDFTDDNLFTQDYEEN